MSELTASTPSQIEQHLDGAYSRVLRVTISLGVIAAVITGFVAGWHNALGLLAGAFLGLLNMVWLHRAADLLVRRMIADRAQALSSTEASAPPAVQGTEPTESLARSDGHGEGVPISEVGTPAAGDGPSATAGPSKPGVMLAFPLRYLLLIAAVYAIVKGYPRVLVSFIVGLALPVLAFMGEGIYEAITIQQDRPRQP